MIEKVLDHGKVQLLGVLGNDLEVVNAAKASFDNEAVYAKESSVTALLQKLYDNPPVQPGDAFWQEYDPKKYTQEYLRYLQRNVTNGVGVLKPGDFKLLNFLAKHEHWSPFRHVQLKFKVKAPEFIARQWWKHCVGNAYAGDGWNEMSMRYVDGSGFDFYIPNGFRLQAKNNKQCSIDETIDPNIGVLDTVCSEAVATHAKVSLDMYKNMIASGIAKEQARCVLPLSVYTSFVWTCSLQALANFIHLRNKPGAQYEIREYADTLVKLVPYNLIASLEILVENMDNRIKE